MRKIINFVSLIMMVIVLIGCTNGEDVKEFKMLGLVTHLDEKIEIEVIQGEYAYGTYLIIADENTEILDSNNKKLSKSDLKINDNIEIIYSGQVMMSYPPQVYAIKIVVKK